MTVRRQLIATVTPQAVGAPLMVDITRGANPVLGVPVTGLALAATGGVGPYAFSLVSGSLPTGLSLASNGVISGTPTVQGTFLFLVQAQDSASQLSPTRSFSLLVEGGLIVPSGKRPIGVRAIPYSYQFRVTDSAGSTAGITYAIQSGSLPAGLSISSSGLVTGTPTSQGYSWVTIRASKSGAFVDITTRFQINWQFTTAGSVVTITDPLKNMVVGVPVRGKVQVTWPLATMPVGIDPYIWTIASGSLPAGLSLSTDGTIQGTPTSPTPYNYVQPTFAVTDKTGTTINVTLAGAQRLIVGAAVKATSPRRFLVTDGSGQQTDINFTSLFFGTGSDGAAVLDGTNDYPWAQHLASSYALSRDVYLTDFSMSAGVTLDMRGFAIYGTGTADLSNASAGAIKASGRNGGAGTAGGLGGPGVGGAGGDAYASLATGTKGGDGAAGSTGTPAAPSAPDNMKIGGGGRPTINGSGPGKGGQGSTGTPSGPPNVIPRVIDCVAKFPFPYGTPSAGAGPIGGGGGGYGGGAGSGDGSNTSGSGGGGGGGGPSAMFAFYEIVTSGSTPAGVMAVVAGNGGNGQSVSTSNIGAGGGGGGGGGGYFHVRYAVRTGTPIAGFITAHGGNGGNGGTNSANSSRNGRGGDAGEGGNIDIVNVYASTSVSFSQSVAPTVQSGTAGATGGRTLGTL